MIKIKEIQKFLPHRYPFLLIDRVIAVEKGKSIIGIKNVTYNEPFFQGHFPSQKIMPGVLIVEALAQAGGILIYLSIPNPEKKFVFLSKIDDMKFRKPVVPGDQLKLEGVVTKIKGKFCQIRARAFVEEEVVAEGDILASILDLEELNGQK